MTLSATAADVASRTDTQLRAAGTAARAVQEKAYLKSELGHYGVSVPVIRKLAKATLAGERALDRDDLLGLVTALWAVPVHERRMLAVELLTLRRHLLVAIDIDMIETLLRQARTWALVDHLAEAVAGDMVGRWPQLGTRLDRWVADDDFWIRRSALLALLGPLRGGGGDFDRFGRYADGMLEEKEFFIRKAIGWVLRDTGRRRPELIFDWLLPRAARCSGVTIREAVKPLSPQQRELVLAHHRERRSFVHSSE
jgi:3-methyladenine DNA glycosylase AlkD